MSTVLGVKRRPTYPPSSSSRRATPSKLRLIGAVDDSERHVILGRLDSLAKGEKGILAKAAGAAFALIAALEEVCAVHMLSVHRAADRAL